MFIYLLLFILSCSKDNNTNTFTPPIKLKYSSFEVGNIERYIVTDIVTPTYTKLSDKNDLKQVFINYIYSAYDKNKFESWDFKLDNKVTYEVSDPNNPNGFGILDYEIKEDKIHIFNVDPSKYSQLLISSPELIKLPLYYSVYFINGIGKIPYSFTLRGIVDNSPSVEDLIKFSINEHSMKANDTVYIMRTDYLYKAE